MFNIFYNVRYPLQKVKYFEQQIMDVNMSKKNPKHYVDNKKFLQAMIDYRKAVQEAQDSGKIKPPIPDYIGSCFLLIAQRLSYKPNFINYTYKDDMISDGIENCLLYIDNFNPEKSQNPFAYFTSIIYYAYLRRIQKEKRQQYIKYKMMQKADLYGELAVGADGGESDITLGSDSPQFEAMETFIADYEKAKEEKRQKRKKKTNLEQALFEDEEVDKDEKGE
jgi:DNA-directed RNA polymerase specialized sigma24 family protein